jgi:hypothetical protein
MLLLLVAAAASASPQTAADMPAINPIADSRLCPETPMSRARKLGEKATRAVPLNELPPAQLFMAVDRRVDGCPAPIVVRYGIGGR